MIKSTQMDEIKEADLHYITTISKPQIKKLINDDVFQLELFQDELCEVDIDEEGVRYILRRNPIRAKEIKQNRNERIQSIKNRIDKSNKYLQEHQKAKPETQITKIETTLKNMKLSKIITINENNRILSLNIDEAEQLEVGRFDGCYVMKTDLTSEECSKETAHDRYKDLAYVEHEFRTQKTGYLEIRGIYLRKKSRTVAHLLVTMLAYRIEKYLREKWSEKNITVEEGLRALSKISTYVLNIGKTQVTKMPKADAFLQELIDLANVIIPPVFPYKSANVYTRKKIKITK